MTDLRKHTADEDPLIFKAFLEDVLSAAREAIHNALHEAYERVPGTQRRGVLYRWFMGQGTQVALRAGECLRGILTDSLRSDFPEAFPAKPVRRYLVLIEAVEDVHYRAYVPDLPGCSAVGRTKEEVKKNLHAAIRRYLQGMQETMEPLSRPLAQAYYVDISVPAECNRPLS